MVIYLTDSLITEDSTKIEDIKACIRNLCIAYSESKHLLFGDLEVIKWGKERIPDETCQIVLNKLIQNYATSSVMPDDVTEYVKVGNWQEKEVEESEQKMIHKASYKFFIDTQHCQRTGLITEDKNDADFYSYILEQYIAQRKRKYNYALEIVPGGGVNMGEMITITMQSKKIAIAIVDTDRRFPKDKIQKGSTCYNCRGASKKVSKDSVFKLYVLDVHEVENILPFNIIEALDLDKEKLAHFKTLATHDNDGDIMRFFDIKKGIGIDDLKKGEEYRVFAEYCYSKNSVLTGEYKFSDKVAEIEKSLNENDKNTNKTIYPGLGSKVLEKTIEYFGLHNMEEEGITLKPFQKEEWDRIGQCLLNYGIARPNEAMN